MTFENCEGWRNRGGPLPEGISCPTRLEYPPPPNQVEVLFIGWNPPGEKHFWNSREDNLYRNLTWVFEQLGWLKEASIWDTFYRKRFYLTHAVKCWNEAKFNWHVPGLIEECAWNLLGEEIRDLNPKAICALGKLPHKALCSLWPDEIPSTIKYGVGWSGTAKGRRVIVTCFPNMRWNHTKKMKNRECTVFALREADVKEQAERDRKG